MKEGKAERELTPYHRSIKGRYLFKGMDGNSMLGTYQLEDPQQLELQKMIPGLAHGIIGMKEGEIREIFIHPDFAYGTSSEFGAGKAIEVKFELDELINEKSENKNLLILFPVTTTLINSCRLSTQQASPLTLPPRKNGCCSRQNRSKQPLPILILTGLEKSVF